MLDKVQRLVRDNDKIVILSGLKMDYECGLDSLRGEKKAFDVEVGYGYSPEEILTEKFLRNRVELFYKYYKSHVLTMDCMHPSAAHYAIASLENQGKILSVITHSSYELHQMAGSKNVMELHGSVHHHSCPKCGRDYDAQYILNSTNVPHCVDCNVILQPEVRLFGEHLDNGIASRCTAAVEQASLLFIAGTVYDSYLAKLFLPYYKGNELVIINDERTIYDNNASCVLRGKCKDIFPQLI